MAQNIHPTVEKLRDDPTPGEFVELVLVPEKGAEESVQERVDDMGLEVTRDFHFGTMAVRAEETDVDELCETADLQSVAVDEEV